MPAISVTIRNTSLEEQDFEVVAAQFFALLQDLTPVDTGFCRDSWEYSFAPDEATFYNPTEYSSYLDAGWSNQAPRGMIGPALAQLPALIRGYR